VEELSILNAGVAGVSDEVVLMVAGCPLYLKGEKN
jgi:adenosyl cobinamide kinase/adenosyl cobinamide phosphate guanylyltransferase